MSGVGERFGAVRGAGPGRMCRSGRRNSVRGVLLGESGAPGPARDASLAEYLQGPAADTYVWLFSRSEEVPEPKELTPRSLDMEMDMLRRVAQPRWLPWKFSSGMTVRQQGFEECIWHGTHRAG